MKLIVNISIFLISLFVIMGLTWGLLDTAGGETQVKIQKKQDKDRVYLVDNGSYTVEIIKDGNTTCYVLNGHKKGGISCLKGE